MHQVCSGQKGESTAVNKTVKDNKWTSHQLLCYNLIPALCHCTKYFPFYSTGSILFFSPSILGTEDILHQKQVSGATRFSQTYLTVCVKGKDKQRQNTTTSCHSQKDCTCDTPILQSTLHTMISSDSMLFFCNSTIISKNILIWQDCIILYLAKTQGFKNRSV